MGAVDERLLVQASGIRVLDRSQAHGAGYLAINIVSTCLLEHICARRECFRRRDKNLLGNSLHPPAHSPSSKHAIMSRCMHASCIFMYVTFSLREISIASKGETSTHWTFFIRHRRAI